MPSTSPGSTSNDTSATARRPPKSLRISIARSTAGGASSSRTLLFQPGGPLIGASCVRVGRDQHLLAVLDLERQVRHSQARVLRVIRVRITGLVRVREAVGAAETAIC